DVAGRPRNERDVARLVVDGGERDRVRPRAGAIPVVAHDADARLAPLAILDARDLSAGGADEVVTVPRSDGNVGELVEQAAVDAVCVVVGAELGRLPRLHAGGLPQAVEDDRDVGGRVPRAVRLLVLVPQLVHVPLARHHVVAGR